MDDYVGHIDLMNKEELQKVDDAIRAQGETLREHLKEVGLEPKEIMVTEEGGLVFLFENPNYPGLHLTADIEFDPNGEITASVIPYKDSGAGLVVYSDPDEPVDLWDVEEEAPFQESVAIIKQRLTVKSTDSST